MKKDSINHYERAFGNWLIDSGLRYVAIDEQKRAAFGRGDLKSFDYLLYPANQPAIIAEVKGRKFTGKSLAALSGLQCWVTADDIAGLVEWQQVLGNGHEAAFVFAYHIEPVDVDLDGRAFYEYDGRRYIFFAVALEAYRRYMKLRSPRWKTVTLSADDFRRCAIQMQDLLL